MDHSTEGVTLASGYVFDILQDYRGLERTCAQLFALAHELDPATPEAPCPIAVYNAVCEWIEHNLGVASVREAGRAIGVRTFARIVREGALPPVVSPVEMMHALQRVTARLIQDPRGRGWDVREARDGRVLMRRTQTFNCVLQEGLLATLAERAGATVPRVTQRACVRRQDEFCEYEIVWTPRARGTLRPPGLKSKL